MLRKTAVAVALLSIIVTPSIWAQDKAPVAGKSSVQEMMKAWIATIHPGPQHKQLEKLTGSWNVTTRMSMNGPDSPPVETKATSECKLILGGRYIQEEITGELMMPDMASGKLQPVPWNVVALYGYDNYRNLYTAVLVDNQSTQMLTMTGTMPPKSGAITFYGQMDEPMLHMVGRMVKYVLKFDSDTERTFTIYDLAAGENHKVIEVKYEKK